MNISHNTSRQIIIRLLVVLLPALAIVAPAKAQNSTSSPLSIFGIGEIEFRDFGATAGMSNAGIGLKARNLLNSRNPAGLSGIDTLKFLFDVAGSVRFSFFRTASQSKDATDFNFKNLAVGCRITKWWTSSVGLSPYTNVGYNIDKIQDIEGTYNTYTSSFTGEGGINRFYWSNSVELLKGLSLGATAAYYFGTITGTETALSIYDSRTMTTNKIKFDFGAQYSHRIGKYSILTLGGIYGYKTESQMYRHQTVANQNTGQVLKDTKLPNSKVTMPETYGGGISLWTHRNNAEWVVAADYSQQNWSVNKEKVHGISFADSRLWTAGVQMIPNTRRPTGYMQIMRYQLGLSYHESYLAIHGRQMKDYSASFGVGLPFMGGLSNVYIAAIVGRARTGGRGGITENYAMLSVNLSLVEYWFSKQKYK